MGNFKKDLTTGQKLENFLCTRLQKRYPLTHVSTGSFKDYDINIPEINTTLECKTDLKSKETGNIAIEFQDRGKPSGIQATKATHWVYRLWSNQHDDWIFVFSKVENWRKICDNRKWVRGGDGFLARMYLIPVKEIINHKSFTIKFLEKEFQVV